MEEVIFLNSKEQVLARLWREGNSSTLLVGLQTGVATVKTVEISSEN